MTDFEGRVTKLDERWTLMEWRYDSNPPQLVRLRHMRSGEATVCIDEDGDLDVDGLDDYAHGVIVPAAAFQRLLAAHAEYLQRKAAEAKP